MRVTIESWGLQDPRLYMLADELGVRRREALGLLADIWYGTQEAHLVVAPRKMIRALCRPEGASWTPDEAVAALLAVGYLVDKGDGFLEVRGNERHVDKLIKAKASAEARWNADGHADGYANAMRTHKRTDMRTQCERNAIPDPDPDKKTEKRESESAQILNSEPLSAVADPTASKLTKTGMSPAKLLALWAEIGVAAGLPRCLALAGKRMTAARTRLREHPDEAYWRDIITRISASAFCQGDNQRGWRGNMDFLLKPDTGTKVLEGQYDKGLFNGSGSGHEDRPTKPTKIWRTLDDIPV